MSISYVSVNYHGLEDVPSRNAPSDPYATAQAGLDSPFIPHSRCREPNLFGKHSARQMAVDEPVQKICASTDAAAVFA